MTLRAKHWKRDIQVSNIYIVAIGPIYKSTLRSMSNWRIFFELVPRSMQTMLKNSLAFSKILIKFQTFNARLSLSLIISSTALKLLVMPLRIPERLHSLYEFSFLYKTTWGENRFHAQKLSTLNCLLLLRRSKISI